MLQKLKKKHLGEVMWQLNVGFFLAPCKRGDLYGSVNLLKISSQILIQFLMAVLCTIKTSDLFFESHQTWAFTLSVSQQFTSVLSHMAQKIVAICQDPFNSQKAVI